MTAKGDGTDGKSGKRYSGLHFVRRGRVSEANIDSLDIARQVFLKRTQTRYKPIVALLRSAFRHTLLIIADGDAWRDTHDAIMPALHPVYVARAYSSTITSVADDVFNQIAAQLTQGDASCDVVEIDVERCMRMITSRDMGCEGAREGGEAGNEVYPTSTVVLPGPFLTGSFSIVIWTLWLRALVTSMSLSMDISRNRPRSMLDTFGWVQPVSRATSA